MKIKNLKTVQWSNEKFGGEWREQQESWWRVEVINSVLVSEGGSRTANTQGSFMSTSNSLLGTEIVVGSFEPLSEAVDKITGWKTQNWCFLLLIIYQ